jgi:hypothetical protein
VKLCGVEVVLVQSSRVGQDIVACGYGEILVKGYVKAMHIVDVFVLADTLEERGGKIVDAVPSHLWNFVFVYLGRESFHFQREYAQAIGVAFLAMLAHQLLSYADAKNGLAQVLDDFVQGMLLEISHSIAGFALSRKEDSVCLSQKFCIVGEDRLYAQSLQCVNHRVYVSCVVFYYCNVHIAYFFVSKY